MKMPEINNKGYAVVIGGTNIDIGGTSHKPLIHADSNPGNIITGCGGVGRNIAHTLSKLGMKVFLVSALGDDYAGHYIKEQCEAAKIDMKYSLNFPGEASSMYIYINDHKGDMAVAVSHMDIVKHITPDYIDSIKDILNGADAVVIDGNITRETYLHIKEVCSAPLYMDPVSTSHAEKIKGSLEGLDVIKPNRLEAEYLTDMTIGTEGDYKAAANELLRQGVKKVFISMGSRGMFAADKDHYYIIDRFPVDVVSTTGAGDSATAGIVWALKDSDIIYASKAANAAASITLRSAQTVSPEISAKKVYDLIDNENVSVKEI